MSRIARGVVLASLAAVVVPVVAHATPSSGVSAVTFTQGAIPAVLAPLAGGAGNYVVREITIAPGGTTGWHYHDGRVLGFVRQGQLTHPGPDCKPVVYSAGETIDEPAGASNVHEGTNYGTTPVILDVVYLVMQDKPLFQDAPAPACAEQ